MTFDTQKIDLEGGMALCWSTPILSRLRSAPDSEQELPQGDNAELAELLREMEKSTSPREGNLEGGWQSPQTLGMREEPVFRRLREWIGGCVSDYLAGLSGSAITGDADFRAWGNITRAGQFHKPHTHPGSQISGVYIVSAGNAREAEGGMLTFEDPRLGIGMIPMPGHPFGRRIAFRPQPGLTVLFPSWLPHYVTPFSGKGERISIAFNVTVAMGATEPK